MSRIDTIVEASQNRIAARKAKEAEKEMAKATPVAEKPAPVPVHETGTVQTETK